MNPHLHFSHSVVLSLFFEFRHSNSVKLHLILGLVCISLMINDVECLFMFLCVY